mmetsp:Transcript_26441/g.36378  ORF Transcript_26441/g.36378 Transcript_26441/m.36378 type:complete len:126 (+) Transcript_26441:62-439(+)
MPIRVELIGKHPLQNKQSADEGVLHLSDHYGVVCDLTLQPVKTSSATSREGPPLLRRKSSDGLALLRAATQADPPVGSCSKDDVTRMCTQATCRLLIVLRGLPGSGKSALSNSIREAVQNVKNTA